MSLTDYALKVEQITGKIPMEDFVFKNDADLQPSSFKFTGLFYYYFSKFLP